MQPALFLDRDGVINIDHDFVHHQAEFTFVDGIFDLCRAAQAAGLRLVVVTNQSGIGRGRYTEEDFNSLTAWMVDTFAARGITIDRVYFSPHYALAADPRYREGAFDRKPSPGMILRAARDLALDLRASLLIGDKLTDMEAGRRAGVGTLCLLDTVRAHDAAAMPDVRLVTSLAEARAVLFP